MAIELHFAAHRVHRLRRRSRSAAAAADQAELDRIAAKRVRPAGDLHLAGGDGRAGDQKRRIARKIPSGGG